MSRRLMLRKAGLTGIILAGGSALWACGGNQTPKASEPASAKDQTPKRGGTLKVGIGGVMQAKDLNIHSGTTGGSDMLLRPVWDHLVNFNEKLEYKPELSLAESWDVVDDATILFKLRKGVKFQDGTEFNAQVLKFNFDRIGNPQTKSPRAYVIDAFKSVEYSDDYTAKIVLKQPMASIFGELAQMGMGMMSPAHVAKYSEQELSSKAVGTGPFMITERQIDSYSLYNRFQDYWRKDGNGNPLPYLDGFRVPVIPDPTVRLANLRTGQLDMDADTAKKDVAALKADANYEIIVANTSNVGMYWNLSRMPFTNLNFRRAVTYAINREVIAKAVTFEISKPFVGFVMPAHAWAFDPNLAVPKYDPVKAKQYLDRAIAEGAKPEFTNYSIGGEYMQTSEMIQADLAQIGINMKIIPATTDASSRLFFGPFDVEAHLNQYSVRPDPYTGAYTAHHSKGNYTPEKNSAGAGWDTPEKYYSRFDPLLEAANKTYDPKKRAEFLNKAAQLCADEVQWLGVYYGMSVAVVNKKTAGGVYLGGDGKARFDRAWLKA